MRSPGVESELSLELKTAFQCRDAVPFEHARAPLVSGPIPHRARTGTQQRAEQSGEQAREKSTRNPRDDTACQGRANTENNRPPMR